MEFFRYIGLFLLIIGPLERSESQSLESDCPPPGIFDQLKIKEFANETKNFIASDGCKKFKNENQAELISNYQMMNKKLVRALLQRMRDSWLQDAMEITHLRALLKQKELSSSDVRHLCRGDEIIKFAKESPQCLAEGVNLFKSQMGLHFDDLMKEYYEALIDDKTPMVISEEEKKSLLTIKDFELIRDEQSNEKIKEGIEKIKNGKNMAPDEVLELEHQMRNNPYYHLATDANVRLLEEIIKKNQNIEAVTVEKFNERCQYIRASFVSLCSELKKNEKTQTAIDLTVDEEEYAREKMIELESLKGETAGKIDGDYQRYLCLKREDRDKKGSIFIDDLFKMFTHQRYNWKLYDTENPIRGHQNIIKSYFGLNDKEKRDFLLKGLEQGKNLSSLVESVGYRNSQQRELFQKNHFGERGAALTESSAERLPQRMAPLSNRMDSSPSSLSSSPSPSSINSTTSFPTPANKMDQEKDFKNSYGAVGGTPRGESGSGERASTRGLENGSDTFNSSFGGNNQEPFKSSKVMMEELDAYQKDIRKLRSELGQKEEVNKREKLENLEQLVRNLENEIKQNQNKQDGQDQDQDQDKEKSSNVKGMDEKSDQSPKSDIETRSQSPLSSPSSSSPSGESQVEEKKRAKEINQFQTQSKEKSNEIILTLVDVGKVEESCINEAETENKKDQCDYQKILEIYNVKRASKLLKFGDTIEYKLGANVIRYQVVDGKVVKKIINPLKKEVKAPAPIQNSPEKKEQTLPEKLNGETKRKYQVIDLNKKLEIN